MTTGGGGGDGNGGGGGGGGGESSGSSNGGGSGGAVSGGSSRQYGGGDIDDSTPLTDTAYALSTPSSSSSSSDPESNFKFLLTLVSVALGFGIVVAVVSTLAGGDGCSPLGICSSDERTGHGHQLKGSVKKRMMIFSHMVERGGVAPVGPGHGREFHDDAIAVPSVKSLKSKRSIGSRIMSASPMKKLKSVKLRGVSSPRDNRDIRGRSRSLESVVEEDAYVRVEDGRDVMNRTRPEEAENVIDNDAYSRSDDGVSMMTMDVFSPGTSHREILL